MDSFAVQRGSDPTFNVSKWAQIWPDVSHTQYTFNQKTKKNKQFHIYSLNGCHPNLIKNNTPKYNKNDYWLLGDIWLWRIDSDGVRVEWFREAKAEGDLVKNKNTDSAR